MSLQKQIKGLREKRGKIAADLRKLGDVMHKENRALNADEQTLFDKLKTDFVAVGEQIRTAETTLGELDSLLSSAGEGEGEGDGGEGEMENARRVPGREDRDGRPKKRGDGASADQSRRDRALALQAWCRKQYGFRLSREHVAACKRSGLNPRSRTFEVRLSSDPKQFRAMSTTATAGGDTIAREFSYQLEMALKDFSNVRGVCDEFRTDTGAALDYPTEDDTGNTGEQLNENIEVTYADDVTGNVVFNAYKFSSKGILVSHELLNDSAFNLEEILGRQAGVRIGRIQGQRFTTGTGVSQPQGIVTASTLGVTAALATAFTADELTRLAFSVDPAYRQDPSFGYMMHDSILAYALLLKDSNGRPLLRESYRDGIVIPMLNGFPVYPNQFMAAAVANAPATAQKHVLVGAFAKHKIRDVGTVRLRKLEERWAEKDQVGFIAFLRSDSRCVNTAAIKHLLQP